MVQSKSSGRPYVPIYCTVVREATESHDKRQRYQRKRFHKIVKGLDTCARIVDVAIQHNPDITALVWAGARFLLQSIPKIYLNYEENLENLEEALEVIVTTMARCEFCETLYEEWVMSLRPSTTIDALSISLQEALPQFYCSVIVFMIKARRYFSPESAIAQSAGLNRLESLMADLAEQFSGPSEAMAEITAHLDQISDEKAMNWLDAVHPNWLFVKKAKSRMEGTCEWISQEAKYLHWKEGNDVNCLWVQGIPKVPGNPFFLPRLYRNCEIRLYYYFWNGGSQTTSPLSMAMRAKLLAILKSTMRAGAAYSDRGRNMKSVWQAFTNMLREYSRSVIIVIDALDECAQDMHREVTDYFFSTPMECPGTKLLITGRPSVQSYFENRLDVLKIKVNECNRNDIAHYIREKVEHHSGLRRHADLIIETVNGNSNGMFLYAGISGMYELILIRLGPRKTHEEIELFGAKEDIYDEEEEREMRKTILLWIAKAERPLRVEEMQYAIATEADSTFDPNTVILPEPKDILKCCDSLVEMYDEKDELYLCFTHLTVQEFLTLTPKASMTDERISCYLIDKTDLLTTHTPMAQVFPSLQRPWNPH
ncbi:hypothetical protein FPQ18DRAFT_306690 [Pyronema domesticum]|nr:hypothetical protein FPQ18DRAFT_306690 [Pyronema domesticum]